MAHGFQSALSGSRFYQASGFAGGYDFFSLFVRHGTRGYVVAQEKALVGQGVFYPDGGLLLEKCRS